MEMKNLTVIRLFIRHKKAAAAKLTVINNENTLEHMKVETFGHSIKCTHIDIQRTDDV